MTFAREFPDGTSPFELEPHGSKLNDLLDNPTRERERAHSMEAQCQLSITNGHSTQIVDLYSPAGLELVSSLWVKLYAHYKFTHDVKWMGIPIIQFPEDILMMEELIWEVQPDVIVECGIAHGGSLVFYSSICELMSRGRVIGVDIEIRSHNRQNLERHPLRHRFALLEGSSTDANVVKTVKSMIHDDEKVLIILDSNHSKAHVAKEIAFYGDLVTPGSYLVVMDGAQAFLSDIPRGKPEWVYDNPLAAIEEFLEGHAAFVVDPRYNRLRVTSNPQGFLRRLSVKEIEERQEKR